MSENANPTQTKESTSDNRVLRATTTGETGRLIIYNKKNSMERISGIPVEVER